ncbi:MAG: zinc-binding dehydrogenase [Planctomycetes bacterium]|nr:zinc-binding dehydrogenase [Planctomycetota bacterium]
MQAARIHAHGGPELLRVEEIPVPKPGSGQALVKVLGVSLNHLDLWVRRGMPGFAVAFPRILGCDGTGEVVALGSGVTSVKVGDKVVIEPGYSSGKSPEDKAGSDHLAPDYSIRGEHSDGIACEYAAVDARYLLPLPKGLDPVQAAAVPLVFITAWGLVVSRARVQSGETVLVLGGASGVGSAAIQLARQRGARVFATAGSADKQRLCRELGAEAVLDHRDPDWGKEFKKHSGGKGADVVVEHVGPATWKTSMAVLARNGRLVTCGGTTGAIVELALPHLFIKNQSVLGSTMGPRSAYPEIFALLAQGVLRPVVDRVLPLSKVREAHELLENRGVVGKIVLVPAALEPASLRPGNTGRP